MIITERLFISPITLNDSEFILELINTDKWKKFIGDWHIHTNEEAIEYIRERILMVHIHYWVVRLKDSLNPIGIVTICKRKNLLSPDLGFGFLPEFEKKGFAKEASSALLNYELNFNKHSEVLAICDPKNISSIRLLHILGFSFKEEIIEDGEVLNTYHFIPKLNHSK